MILTGHNRSTLQEAKYDCVKAYQEKNRKISLLSRMLLKILRHVMRESFSYRRHLITVNLGHEKFEKGYFNGFLSFSNQQPEAYQ